MCIKSLRNSPDFISIWILIFISFSQPKLENAQKEPEDSHLLEVGLHNASTGGFALCDFRKRIWIFLKFWKRIVQPALCIPDHQVFDEPPEGQLGNPPPNSGIKTSRQLDQGRFKENLEGDRCSYSWNASPNHNNLNVLFLFIHFLLSYTLSFSQIGLNVCVCLPRDQLCAPAVICTLWPHCQYNPDVFFYKQKKIIQMYLDSLPQENNIPNS